MLGPDQGFGRGPNQVLGSLSEILGLFLLTFVPNLISILLGLAGYDLRWLWASPSTPWGVVTANFVSPTTEDFVLDSVFFVLYLWGFAVLEGLSGEQDRRQTGILLAIAAFVSAVVAISILVWSGGKGSGSSGVVYATAGVVLGRALVQRGWVAHLGERGSSHSKSNSYILLAGLLLGLPVAILGGGNLIVHAFSFILGAPVGALLARSNSSNAPK